MHVIEMVLKQTGPKMLHVPFKGETDGLMATIGGTTHLMAPVLSTALPQVKQGKLAPLVIFDLKRSLELPNVPTAAEVELIGFENIGWSGIAAKTGTAPQIVEKRNAVTQALLNDPTVVQKLGGMQVRAMPGSSSDLMRYTIRDSAKWRDAIGDLDSSRSGSKRPP